MANRTLTEQYRYETEERGLSHSEAMKALRYMFAEAELEPLQLAYTTGYEEGRQQGHYEESYATSTGGY